MRLQKLPRKESRVRQLKRTELASELEALNASGCSPVRLTPAVGVTTGAHYRMSTGHSSPALAHEARGGPVKVDGQSPIERRIAATVYRL